MKFACYFPTFGNSGWELLCRNIVLSLDKLGVDIKLMHKDEWNREVVELSKDDESRLNRMCNSSLTPAECDLHLLHQYVTNTYIQSKDCQEAKAKRVCISLFETDKCPTPWKYGFNKIDEVWTFSEFNKIAWEKSGVKRVKVMPFGIDTKLFTPDGPKLDLEVKKEFTFISNGDCTERKWFEGLIEAYVKEFKGTENVCLLIKSHSMGFIRKHKDNLVNTFRDIASRFDTGNPPLIQFIGDKVPCSAMPMFYRTGDCFVLPSRGEGLGLPYAEALACGVPVISTGWGGQTEFLNNDNSYLLNYGLNVIDDTSYIMKCPSALNHQWALPNLQHLMDTMRFAYEFRDEIKLKGIQGRKDMLERTNQSMGLWIIKRLLELKGVVEVKS